MPLAAALSPLARTRRIDQRTRGASNMDVLESGEARDSIDTTAFPLRVKMANGRSSSTIAIIYRLKMTVKQIRVSSDQGRGQTPDPPIFRSRDNSPPKTVSVRGLRFCPGLNADESR